MELNEFQTQLTPELLESLPAEIRESLLDYINSVPYISRMVSKDRKRAKDLERDSRGRIIVDIANLHILENMNYFRKTALHYEEHGCYTKLRPNSNPNSEYGIWLREEIHRCWYGMVRESDGEWITGYMYWYLNYFPMIQDIEDPDSGALFRITKLPKAWEGVYMTFHYLDQARYGGLYNDFKGNQQAVEIAKRGASKSYIISSMLAKNFILGENKIACTNTRGVITAYEKGTIEADKDGTLSKFLLGINFLADNTEFPRNRIKDSKGDLVWISGYLDAESNRPKGSENTVIGVSSRDNPDKNRGKRANLFLYEEFGAFKLFLDTYMVNLPSVMISTNKSFGLAFAIGTGGSEGNDFMGAMEMIYNPAGYFVYGVPNIYDKGSQGNKKTVLFFGAPINRYGFYNEDGVSDIIGALIDILQARHMLKYNSTDPIMLSRFKAENPITIQEAIMKRDNNIYPVSDLTDQLNKLDLTPNSYDYIQSGRLTLLDGKITLTPDIENLPIREFPHKDNKLHGAVEIHDLPKVDKDGKVFKNRYIAGADPYDDDVSETLSLGSIFVLDLWTDKIVAEYTGRPLFAETYYETCRRLLLLYDAECNYENNKKGLYAHFSKYGSLYLLSDVLEFLKDKDPNLRELYGNKSKGTTSVPYVKKYGRSLLRNWLISPFEQIVQNPQTGEEEVVQIKMLNTLNSRGAIKELTMYNVDNNFDRHDALVMLMLLREDKLRYITNSDGSRATETNGSSGYENDSFFTKNYGR